MTRKSFTSVGRNILDAPVRSVAALSVALAVAVSLASCDRREHPVAPASSTTESLTPRFTMSSGSVSTLVGRGTFASGFKVKRKTAGWKVSVDTDPLDIAVQTIVFQPGAQSGWHSHPGPVFILVTQGQMTFYESNDPACSPIVRSAGQGYLDAGDHPHIARNETLLEARNLVTYFAPVGATLRIDAPAPGNCAF